MGFNQRILRINSLAQKHNKTERICSKITKLICCNQDQYSPSIILEK